MRLFQGDSWLPAAGEKERLFRREKNGWKYIYCITWGLFHSPFHVFSRDPRELLGTRTQGEIRNPPSPEHSASEKKMKEETESLPWPIFLAVLWYSTRFFLLPVLSRAMNTICNRNHSAHQELKDPKPLPWTQRLSEHTPLHGASLNQLPCSLPDEDSPAIVFQLFWHFFVV